jgi:hypothetical protein
VGYGLYVRDISGMTGPRLGNIVSVCSAGTGALQGGFARGTGPQAADGAVGVSCGRMRCWPNEGRSAKGLVLVATK